MCSWIETNRTLDVGWVMASLRWFWWGIDISSVILSINCIYPRKHFCFIISCVKWSWLIMKVVKLTVHSSYDFSLDANKLDQRAAKLTESVKLLFLVWFFFWISPQSCPEYEFLHQPCVRRAASGSPSPVGGSLRILWIRIPQLQPFAFLLPLLQGLCGWFLRRRLRYRRDRFYIPL